VWPSGSWRDGARPTGRRGRRGERSLQLTPKGAAGDTIEPSRSASLTPAATHFPLIAIGTPTNPFSARKQLHSLNHCELTICEPTSYSPRKSPNHRLFASANNLFPRRQGMLTSGNIRPRPLRERRGRRNYDIIGRMRQGSVAKASIYGPSPQNANARRWRLTFFDDYK
jgi:hypothetical protein